MIFKKIIYSAFILFFLSVQSVCASEYSQPGFYDVENYQLDNGLKVVIKPRHTARNVSVHLLVNVGHMNFPCGKRETAHFLEHLLFTGTEEYSEVELHDIIESHGGSWNAETGRDYTLYYIDIFSKNVDVALSTLYKIISASTITPENVEKSRRIVYRESGGKPSVLRSWLFENDLIIDASTRAMNLIFPGIEYQCKTLDNTDAVSYEDIINAYRNYYVAANMTLVLVGDIQSENARMLVNETFAKIPKVSIGQLKTRPQPEAFQQVSEIVEGRWQPVVNSDASVHLLYRTGGVYSDHYYPLVVLVSYFQTELYNRVRVEAGMAYDPTAYMYMHNDYGAFVLETDSELDDVEHNIKLIKETIGRFKNGDFNQQRLEAVKRKILLNVARGYESNSSFAEYYALNAEELKRYGKYENYEDHIERVSLKDIQTVANTYFNDDNLVVAIVKPTFNYTQFYLLLLAAIAVLMFTVWRIIRSIRRRHFTDSHK